MERTAWVGIGGTCDSDDGARDDDARGVASGGSGQRGAAMLYAKGCDAGLGVDVAQSESGRRNARQGNVDELKMYHRHKVIARAISPLMEWAFARFS